MGLDKAQGYIIHKRMHDIQDWGSVELDDEGKALQAELEARQTVSASCPRNCKHGSHAIRVYRCA